MWQKFYLSQNLTSQKAFQQTFHNLTNAQLLQLKNKFENLPDQRANVNEFPSTILISHLLTAAAQGRDQISHSDILASLGAFTDARAPYQLQLKNLILIQREIDAFAQNFIGWSTFSQHIMQSANFTRSASLTNYFAHQSMHQLMSAKVQEPIYSLNYSQETDCFIVCLKDNLVQLVNRQGNVVHKIKTTSMPVAAATFRPHIDDYNSYGFDLRPSQSGWNLIVSGTDRKLSIYNNNQLINAIPTENVHTVIKTNNIIYFRRQRVQPAIFTGDDKGQVHFWRLNGQDLTLEEEIPEHKLKVFVEEDEIEDDEEGTNEDDDPQILVEVNATDSENIAKKKFEEYKKYQELALKMQIAAQSQQLSPTPIWSIQAHKNWVNTIILEFMENSGQFLLASGSSDGSICTFDVNQGIKAASLLKHSNVSSLAWLHQRGLLVSVGSDRQLNIWVPSSTQNHVTSPQAPIASLPYSNHPYISVFASKTKPEFLTVDVVGNIQQWDIRKLEPVFTIVGNASRNGKAVSAAYNDRSGHICTATNMLAIAYPQNANQQIQITQSTIENVAISSLNPGIVIASDQILYIWDLRSGKCVGQIENFIFSGKTVMEGKESAIGTIIGKVDNSDTVGLNVLQNMNGVFSSDRTGAINLISGIQTSEKETQLEINQGTVEVKKQVTALSLSLNGQYLAIATDDERIVFYQTQNGQMLLEFQRSKDAKPEQSGMFVEQYQKMNKAKSMYQKVKATMQFQNDKLDNQEQNVENIKNFGVCTDIFFSESNCMEFWVCFKEKKMIMTYKFTSKENYQLNAKFRYKQQWKSCMFNAQRGQLVLLVENDISIIQFDGSPLVKTSISVEIKFIDISDDMIMIILDNDLVQFIDYESMNIFAYVKIPEISNSLTVKFSQQNQTLLQVNDCSSVITYNINFNTAFQNYKTYKKQSKSLDIHIPLTVTQSIQDFTYQASFTSRRITFNVLEISEAKEAGFDVPQNKDFCQEIQFEILNSLSYIDETKFTDICLNEVYYHQLANLFVISTALGYVLCFSAISGQFVQFLTLTGWEYEAKAQASYLHKRVVPSTYLNRVIQENDERLQKAQEFQHHIGDKLNGKEPILDYIENITDRQRMKSSINAISEVFWKDVENYNQKKIKMQQTDKNISQQLKSGTQRIMQSQLESKELFRAKSQLNSPIRKQLPTIPKSQGRMVLARAISQASTIAQETNYRYQKEVKTVKFDINNIEKRITENAKKVELPTLLNMTKRDLAQKYKKE
ncbi:hypothetical protein SS50377_23643 [Spironucleus salmonicida]|uniref:Uncharacterized protein n=1 Tax=Spironucleus salmonicida TaxID=348837 RepID=V6LVF1_9EUKA|nr:hypothetical protein SS50377_23643 [Spironucleus salmonicida]|eukprot:EST48627.1 hypothetical protein SS50377_11239 [Spironucleus salmonicida]